MLIKYCNKSRVINRKSHKCKVQYIFTVNFTCEANFTG